jgi:hypothetical protein
MKLPNNDTERLDTLLEYLEELQGALAHIADTLNVKPAQSEKRRAAFQKRFGVEPGAALQNALDDLTRHVLQVRAQRLLDVEEAEPDA